MSIQPTTVKQLSRSLEIQMAQVVKKNIVQYIVIILKYIYIYIYEVATYDAIFLGYM